MGFPLVMSVITAGIVLLSDGLYIRSILKGKTKPSRSSFWIWALVQAMTAISYAFAGGGFAITLSATYAVGFLFIAILSVRHGSGHWEKFDTYALIGAFLAAGAWAVTRSPFVALVLLLTTDLIGALPTIKKSFLRPFEEHKLAWVLTCLASITNALSVAVWSMADSVYTIYILAINVTITVLVLRPISKK